MADDIDSVTSYNPEEECDPDEAGLTRSDVEFIWDKVKKTYKTGCYPAIGFCLRRHGKIVLNRSIGHARGNGPNDPIDGDSILASPKTPICFFSGSKAITAMLVHLLDERKEINLLDPVARYLSEFQGRDKRNITIYQLLTHRSGIPSVDSELDPDKLFDEELVADEMMRITPRWAPGLVQGYHAATGGYVLGQVIEKVTGMKIREFLHQEFKQPLGMRFFNYGLEDEDIQKRALNYVTGYPLTFPVSEMLKKALGVEVEKVVELSNDPRFCQISVPAANIMATAEEISRFYQMMLNGGRYNGRQILSPATIHRATQPFSGAQIDRVLLMPMKFSAGFMLGTKPYGLYGPNTQHAFGHLGFTNKLGWADPERDISVAILTSGNPVLGTHVFALLQLLNAINNRCRREFEPRWAL